MLGVVAGDLAERANKIVFVSLKLGGAGWEVQGEAF
jgi:hypothetical protein